MPEWSDSSAPQERRQGLTGIRPAFGPAQNGAHIVNLRTDSIVEVAPFRTATALIPWQLAVCESRTCSKGMKSPCTHQYYSYHQASIRVARTFTDARAVEQAEEHGYHQPWRGSANTNAAEMKTARKLASCRSYVSPDRSQVLGDVDCLYSPVEPSWPQLRTISDCHSHLGC